MNGTMPMSLRMPRALAALLLALAVASAAHADEPREEPQFVDLSMKTVRVSDHLGDVVLVNFWATWCGPCRQEVPALAKLNTELQPKGLRIIGAAGNGRDDAATVQAAMKDLGVNYEVWLWVTAKDMAYYGVGPGIPATVLVDRKGVVRARFPGVIDPAKARPIIEAVLAEK
jgi:cytochrome c biogenesis protein CcmG/thiol:disulfide interchange protein DsbE